MSLKLTNPQGSSKESCPTTQSNPKSLASLMRNTIHSDRVVRVEALGGYIDVDLDGLSMDHRFGIQYRGHQVMASHLGPVFVGVVFYDCRCADLTEASVNSTTALHLAHRLVNINCALPSTGFVAEGGME